MDTLNEIRIMLTDFGRQCLRKDHTPDFMALINKTAKDIFALCNASAEPTRWKPKQGESYWMIQNDGEVEQHRYAEEAYDEKKWNFGNCFHTRAQAEQARDTIKEVLSTLHKKLGVTCPYHPAHQWQRPSARHG